MKINKKQSVSGTGNGIREEYIPSFIQALKDFEKLIRTIYKKYEEAPKDTFSDKFHLINSWHNCYKIELRREEFPFDMCNGIDIFYSGWNDVILSCKFPLKFKAQTFGGGDTENMSVALTTQLNISKKGINSIMEDSNIPSHIKIKILEALRDYYREHTRDRYKEDMKEHLRLIDRHKKEIVDAEEMIEINTVNITKIEKRIKEIENVLKKYE